MDGSGLRGARNERNGWLRRGGSGAGRRPSPEQTEPRLFEATVRHTRRAPFRHSFDYRTHTWLVDLDHLPAPRRTRSFEARDHLGSPDRTIRENLDAFLATEGVDLDGGRVLMLANARAFGYCFNPISVFWCHDRSGDLACTVLEVHNTYGDRHAYLVRTDEHGKARTDKAMYVSPFHDVSGRYDISAPEPTDTVAVAITLRHQSGPAFTASLTGYAVSGRPPLRATASALVGSVRIRIQGIRLWLRRLPIRPRPDHPRQEGVQ